MQVIAPLLTEILGIEALPAALSIVWTGIGIPTACKYSFYFR